MYDRGDTPDGRHLGLGGPNRFEEAISHLVPSTEQHLTLGEVTEERALGRTGAVRDLGNRGGVAPALDEQVQRGAFQAFPRIRLPSTHGATLNDDTKSHHLLR